MKGPEGQAFYSLSGAVTGGRGGATCSAKELDYQTHHLVTQQMSHQADVSRKYYEAVHGKRDAAFAFQKLEGLRTGSKAGTSETGGLASQRWSTLDTAFVKKKFAACIKNARTPGLPECSEIGLDRTAKQVQDKVRTLIRQAPKRGRILTLITISTHNAKRACTLEIAHVSNPSNSYISNQSRISPTVRWVSIT